MTVLYRAEATASGDGRSGEAASRDGRLKVTLSRPPEMGGSMDDTGTNPEQLFAAGYAACFHSALRTIARRQRQDVEGSSVTARVALQVDDEKNYSLQVELMVDLSSVELDLAQQMAEQAHKVCPYSRAIRDNVVVELSVMA